MSTSQARCAAVPPALPTVLMSVLLTILPAAGETRAQEGPGAGACPRAAGAAVERGWAAYRADSLDAARRAFEAALARCPDQVDATVGVGYVALRRGRGEAAEVRFRSALEADPGHVDALTGLGILAWRAGDLEAVADRFGRVRELDPGNATARDYLARLPGGAEPAPARPPLALPDTLVVRSRVRRGRFEVLDGRWRPFYVRGVNLGAALPGRFPSQFPREEVYRRWIGQIADVGFSVVRLYTIHPPGFYRALAEHNAAHPDDPLRLIHGVWTGLPPDSDYDDRDWRRSFVEEMRRVVDVVHGRADVEPRPGHASGRYTADVSRWTLAWIVGREWEPYSVERYDDLRAGASAWRGEFLEVRDGSPMDVWLARACEEIVAYETERYREQRPVAYTNWPTLDPLRHPTEATTKETWALRRALGESVGPRPPRYDFDDDAVGLDATTTRATGAFRAGWFAAYHVYPYYPDFLVLDPGYREARSPFGPSTYWGYLRELKRHHGEMALLVAEYGVPASLGIAHQQPQGWHHGGHTEAEMARIDARLTREIAAAGLAGGVLFAWIDEWFKKNWLVARFELPEERNRLWYNRMDAEQHYGVVAMEPEPAVAGEDTAARTAAWDGRRPLYRSSDGRPVLRAAADAAALWLRVDLPAGVDPGQVLVGFDMVGPADGTDAAATTGAAEPGAAEPEAAEPAGMEPGAMEPGAMEPVATHGATAGSDAGPGPGDVHWPAAGAPPSPVGMEFVLRARRRAEAGGDVRLLADEGSNPLRLRPIREGIPPPGPEGLVVPEIEDPPPGFFHARVAMAADRPFVSRPNADGVYDSLRVVTNRARLGRDTTEFAALGYDRGVLPRGERPDGFWTWSPDGRRLEIRIPWLLLNVTDPSSRSVLQDWETGGSTRDGAPSGASGESADADAFGTVRVPDVGLLLAVRDAEGRWHRWPESDAPGAVARWTWPTWEEPAWRARPRPVSDAMSRVFRQLEPFDADPGAAGRSAGASASGPERPEPEPDLEAPEPEPDREPLEPEPDREPPEPEPDVELTEREPDPEPPEREPGPELSEPGSDPDLPGPEPDREPPERESPR